MKNKGFTLIELLILISIIAILVAIIIPTYNRLTTKDGIDYKITLNDGRIFILDKQPTFLPDLNCIEFNDPKTGSYIRTSAYTMEEIINVEMENEN